MSRTECNPLHSLFQKVGGVLTLLVTSQGWTTIFICFIVAFAILGIDAMAVEIENPFGHDFNDLPLGMICETIGKNVREILDRSQHPERKQAFDGKPALW